LSLFAKFDILLQGDGKYLPENIDARLCSHVIYAYANLDSDSLEIVPSAPKVDVESGKLKFKISMNVCFSTT
jgi:GH18 family chitinase